MTVIRKSTSTGGILGVNMCVCLRELNSFHLYHKTLSYIAYIKSFRTFVKHCHEANKYLTTHTKENKQNNIERSSLKITYYHQLIAQSLLIDIIFSNFSQVSSIMDSIYVCILLEGIFICWAKIEKDQKFIYINIY